MAPEWRNNFAQFFTDMGPRPNGRSLDRISNDGPYAPGNCRWATASEQSSNTSQNVYAIYQGERITIAELARRMGINQRSLRSTIKRYDADPVEIAEMMRDIKR